MASHPISAARRSASSGSADAATAVALHHLVEREVRREDLLVAWLLHLEARYAALLAGGADGVLADYRHRCSTLGRAVRAELPGELLDGVERSASRL